MRRLGLALALLAAGLLLPGCIVAIGASRRAATDRMGDLEERMKRLEEQLTPAPSQGDHP